MNQLEGVKVIFQTIVGSQAYGTNVEGSDVDIKGVYIQKDMDLLTFGYRAQIEVNKDEVYYEVRRFIELLSSANPTVLEMLYSPVDCIQVQEPEFDILMKYRDEFLTKKCKDSFGGYAVQQIKKAKGLNKKMNWEKEKMTRKDPLDFCFIHSKVKGAVPFKVWASKNNVKQEKCGLTNVDHMRDCYNLYTDIGEVHNYAGIVKENSNTVRLSSIPKGILPNEFLYYNKDGYTQHCNAYKEYETWLKERNTQRYVDLEGHGQKIDGKNMLHCRRLIDTALEIARDGKLNVRRPNADYLRDIRKGKVNLQTLLETAELSINAMDLAFANSKLPEEFPSTRGNEILTEIRSYRPSLTLLQRIKHAFTNSY